jgi:hypothetical protein
MRWCRVLAAGGLAAALWLPGAAFAADKQHIGLHDMSCTGISAMGEGLQANTAMVLTLVDQDNGSTLARQTVRTSPKGAFMVRMQAQLNQVLSLRLLVSKADGTKVGFADHSMAPGAAMCKLPFTGPKPAAALLSLGGGSLGLGLLLLAFGTRRDRAAARA